MKVDMKRRWLKLLAGLVMALLVFAACGESAPSDDGDEPGGEPSASAPAEAEFTTLEDGVLKVGSCLDYPPFESIKGGEETGFDVEMTEAIAEKLGLEVKWVKANFDTIFTAVAGGRFDMVAAASTITDERLQVVDFSDPYFNSRQGLTINTNETPDIATIDDIKSGDVVGVQKGTTGKAFAEDNLASKGVQIKTFDGAPDAFTDLEAGNIVAVINDEGSSIEIASERSGLEVVQAVDTDEHYGFAFSQDNPELTAAANEALAEIIAEGTYAAIFTKYFPDLPVPEEFQAS